MVSTPAEAKPLLQDRDRLEERLREIPLQPGIYLMRDKTGHILYIGKSKKLRSRVRSYFRKSGDLSESKQLMLRQVVDIEFVVTDTEAEALALEANLVKQHQPHFNVLLKDDKRYPYLCITWSEEYPRIFITRRRRLGRQKDKYYGPYVDARALRMTLRLVRRIFPQRQRPRPLFKDRPCINYHLGRCPGVCQGMISSEDYRKTIQKIAMVFEGRSVELAKALAQRMEVAAEELNFELAARLRDRIAALNALTADQKVSLPDDTVSRDAIALVADAQHACIQLFQTRAGKLVGRLGFFADIAVHRAGNDPGAILQRVLEEHYARADPIEIPSEVIVQHDLPDREFVADWLSGLRGRKVSIVVPQRQAKAELIEMVERNARYELERTQRVADRNAQALQDLATILDLPEPPKRIEGYDISHIQGANAVGSQVVFVDGIPAKQHYRHYKIKNPAVRSGRSDDFASLAEIVRRRFRKFAENPDLDRQGNPDFPDLVVIDGGKGQLSSVVAVLQTMNLLQDVAAIGLAKRREEIFLPGESQPLPTNPEQPGVQVLRRLRDEAHRFAINFHRRQRTNQQRRSRLNDIPGLGHHRQKELLAHFRSIDYIREASPEQIAEVPGIGPRLARQIYNYFHPA
ncbi:excinuclease ABC, C subunit [Rubidibacter lacunae KORDI 51-2]|uniref:UvrABC system protein C n=1 Tax=Rubidibacter lacunae KORDI 51-2 TaxID=582515 RepID=U5DP30_9CHRO|nr:excinuclease ABC subunit UvrC [Rubidibacter lacunae]ERN41465.1 excinuclease ABC, C subunit [Rubidibacter lacunae KORDI 51-2]